MVWFKCMILIKFDFIWCFFCVCEYWFDYDIVCICSDGFCNIIREMNIVICDNWNIMIF